MFIRGYFDGDGCVFIERSENGHPRKLLTVFTSASYGFLEGIHQALVDGIGIEGTRIYRHGSSNAYQIRYATRNSLRLFLFLYGEAKDHGDLYLKRKYAIFNEYLQLKNISIEDIPTILRTKGPVVNRKHDGLQNRYSAGSTPAWASDIMLSSHQAEVMEW